MDTSRDDVGIAIRSAFLKKGTQQRFSLFALTIVSILLIFLENIETKPLNKVRAFIKDAIFRGAAIVSYPSKSMSSTYNFFEKHLILYKKYDELVKENIELKRYLFLGNFSFLLASRRWNCLFLT